MLAALVTITAISPLSDAPIALAYRQVWHWLLEPQYGPGPTILSWFGIVTLFTAFVFVASLSKRARDEDAKIPSVAIIVLESILKSAMAAILVLVGASWIYVCWR